MKRIVTIQDISCMGRCSLTVALPIISAMGVETAIIPTAVLSTHTMIKNYTFRDLTEEIVPITRHWKEEQFGFDAIYTGYLGSLEQIDIVSGLFDEFKTESNLIVVDPVLGDNGKLYPAFDETFVAKMASLCKKADIIVPNMTEASFLTGMEYKEHYDEEYVKKVLRELSLLGARISILTGAAIEDGKTGAYGYDREKDQFFSYFNERIEGNYHGTGDIFSSTLVGALMNGMNLKESLKIAADYTKECSRVTVNDKDGCWYGVHFEQAIPYLLKLNGK